MLDFEDTCKYNAIQNQLPRLVFIGKNKFNSSKERDLKAIIQSLNNPDLGIGIAPEYFREAFTRGFMDGNKNPGKKRQPITLDMLLEAFDLPDLKLSLYCPNSKVTKLYKPLYISNSFLVIIC